MTDADHMVHVSGHPARDELRRLYRLVQPRFSVPVHGEWRHLSAHAALAQEAGATPILMEDGDILSLAPGRPEIVDSAPVGRLVLDGNRLVPLQGGGDGRAAAHAVQRRRDCAAWRWTRPGRLRGDAAGQRARPVRARRSGDRRASPRSSRTRSPICRRRCAAMMRRSPMRRGRRCGARSASGCRSGRWSMCICCGSEALT